MAFPAARRIRNSQHRIAPLMLYAIPSSGLRFLVSRQSVVEITAQAHIERPCPFCDLVLDVKRELFYIGVSVETEKASSTGEVKRKQISAGRSHSDGVYKTGITVGIGERRNQALSTIPRLSFSLRNVCWYVPPIFRL